jgi:hypothetical protein
MLTRRAVAGAAAATLAASLSASVLTGCGGGDDPKAPATPTTDTAGDMTAPGTRLGVGDSAVVGFAADAKRQSTVRLTVTGAQHGTVRDLGEFELDQAAKKSGVYYVRATVRNIGRGDLGGAFVKLFAKVSDTLVVQPVIFGSTFGKCDYQPLPKPFGPGRRAAVCMVMLVPNHGSVSAVEWRFAGKQADDAPISWELP